MDIQEFIAQCEGNWFAQRTDYYIGQEKFENGQTTLSIEVLPAEHPLLQELCQQHQIRSSLGAIKTSWTSKPSDGSTLIVFAADDTPNQGKLVQIMESNSVSGRYSFGDDEALTLLLTEGSTSWEERLWFASPNLRLRTSLAQQQDGFSTTSFYSEIRKMPPKSATD